ncbi:TIGR01457 family HAD-type hydrolase [Paenibacillus tarimensis]|uniref:TIGR01457 family HAD-type hydrolase n=1 Tax=Paenibacillus tarimensis TaxID=416012 RepID=UPI001F30D342|nr:TIGR01457 family HAD-type hydrolase [Paenibacillus tarimensis]MCF2942680.1 TIGR01457 family HAD-type hydrolase [Paenibacillus tarimensis]
MAAYSSEQTQTALPQGLLIDLDGTLFHGSVMIDGADRLIRLLKELELPYLFVTNNSSASPETVAERMQAMGIPAEPEDVCTSAQGAAAYIAGEKPGAKVAVIGEEGLLEAVRGAGLNVVYQNPDYVLQGIDRGLTYDKVAEAVRLIRGGAGSIMTNPDLLLPSEGGVIPGAGSIGAMIQAASGVQPVVIGKPSPILMNVALERLGIGAERALVIGDNLATDIAAGNNAGCRSLLVMTGITNKDNYEALRLQAGAEPDQICEDLNELISYISAMFRK